MQQPIPPLPIRHNRSVRRRHPPARAGFTLIEMLVVVAIIGILAAMLMPALQNSIESARRMACANNLRQQGAALQMYLGDFSGKWGQGANTVCGNDTSQGWSGYGTPGLYSLGHLAPYHNGGVDAYYCLSTEWDPTYYGGISGTRDAFLARKINAGGIASYAFGLIPTINGRYNNSTDYLGKTFSVGNWHDNPAIFADMKMDGPTPRVYNHRGGGVNAGYLDASVRWLDISQLPVDWFISERNSLQWVGHQMNKSFWQAASGFKSYQFNY